MSTVGVNSSLETLFGRLEKFVSSKTVVGEPMTIGDVIIVPLVDVSFGLGAGAGSNYLDKSKKASDKEADATTDKVNADAGMGGMGAKITPSAVLVIINGTAQLVNVKNQDSLSKLIDMAPGIAAKLNLGSLFSKDKKDEDCPDNDTTSEEPEPQDL